VRIVEVGPRDGLQNEPIPISTEEKVQFIQRLADAGVTEIEATSFVSPKWVPQLGDAADLWPALPVGPIYSALVPNRRGFETALNLGVMKIALFTAASDAFTQRNINRTVAESLVEFGEILSQRPAGMRVRGYVSTAFDCPFCGPVAPAQVRPVVESLLELGCDEISIGDTLGTANPSRTRALARELSDVPNLFWHFHDTYGRAVANVMAAMESGVGIGFDASAGGLGGCPYAPGATGNLATEDLVCLLESEGISIDNGIGSGIDQVRLALASVPILERLGRPVSAKSQAAILSHVR